jgi:transposase
VSQVPIESIRLVKNLYPRLKPIDDVIERYRDALDNLPPIVVARGGVLVDGYHRWQAYRREGADVIDVEDLGDLLDDEIFNESIRRNSEHGQQLSAADKRALAARLWNTHAHLAPAERNKQIQALLAVSQRTVEAWTKDARQSERETQRAKAWDLWLDCWSERAIAKELGVTQPTAAEWVKGMRTSAESFHPPESRQHFDIWQFPTADQDAGAQSYFGALPPQVVENLLWFFTEPGDIVVDLFAGSGTTIDVAKAMGRRVWASDIRGDHYSPHLPIHAWDASAGWPPDAPKKAALVLLDPPYWKQAAGRYSTEDSELAELSLDAFYAAWRGIVGEVMEHAERIAYIISPTQDDDGTVIDHATDMLDPFVVGGWQVERRVIVPYSTQQATGQQVTWARENRRMLKLYRDLVVLEP